MSALAEIEAQPHARAVLGPALSGQSNPSHAYLFHGPAGSGKRTVAKAFAAALLSDGARSPDTVAARVAREAHPDLTWVCPSGASEMLVGDIDEPVVAAATRTPFESARRVFVIEDADAMNDQAANRMLKTLEEPAPFVHLILLAPRVDDVLATIASRCQQVRFDPLPAELIEERLRHRSGIDPIRARACSRLALGDASQARTLASQEGEQVRSSGERYVREALHGQTARGWATLLESARHAGERAGAELDAALAGELELAGSKERARRAREGAEARKRLERRMRTRTLDLGLRIAELWLRDLVCLAEGAPELVHAVDRLDELRNDCARRPSQRLRNAVELVADTRRRLALNVSEELALEALAYRLQAALMPR